MDRSQSSIACLPEREIPELDIQARPTDAECLISASELLLPKLEAGEAIDAPILRTSMEDAFGASDTDGAWVWKDAYEAVEIAQIMMLSRYGSAMKRQAATPEAFLAMIEKLAALAPTHTRRSEESQKLQQFSTPLPLAALVAQAADIRPDDLILEPSAGNGMLAIFGQISGAKLVLNELGDTRREILSSLFPQVPVTGHDAASIDDRLDHSIQPSLILMNPPFSVAPKVEGRYKHATSQHVLSALSRLAPGGRLVLISGSSFNPAIRSFQSTFARIAETANVVFSCPIAGRVFAKHGTTIDTRLTVIDKNNQDNPGNGNNPDAFLAVCETLADLHEALTKHCLFC